MTDHSSQITMIRGIEVGWVADGAAELDGFQRVGVIEGHKFGYEIWALGFQPKVKEQASSVDSAASVHEAGKGRVDGIVESQANCDVRHPVVDGDRHRREHQAGRGSMGGEGLRKH